MPNLAAVVFDLDGTLVDSVPDIAAAVNVALKHAGRIALEDAAVAGMVGGGSEMLIARALQASGGSASGEPLLADVHTAFLAAYDGTPCRYSKLYPHARETLDLLIAQGIRLAICTNKPQPITQSVLAALGIADRFASVIGGRDGLPLKPAADMLLQALAELDVTPERAAMVGDSPADAGAARAAGTRLVLLSHGYTAAEVLEALRADALLPGFTGLPAALEQMTFPAA